MRRQAFLLDQLSLAATKKSAPKSNVGLAQAQHNPSPQGEAPQACTGWFIYKYTDVSFFVVSIFCFCGKRRKVRVEGRVGVVMW